MKKAIITGSFDPITSGHEDLIRRAAALFDEVTIVIVANTEKRSGMFRAEDRLLFAEKLAEHLTAEGAGSVNAILYGGLTSDAAHKVGADFIVRGVRNASDFDYEYGLSNIMKRFDPALETILLPADPTLSCVSSTYVRELLKYRFSLQGSVPDCIADLVRTTYEEER